MQVSERVKQVGGAAKKLVRDILSADFFSDSAIKRALEKLSLDKNRIHHILMPSTGKHAWDRVCKNSLNWEEVKLFIEKVRLEGDLFQKTENGFEKSLTVGKDLVEVRFVRLDDGSLRIGSAWVSTYLKKN